MASILVLYGTGEGQTAKLAERIVGTLAESGHDAAAVDAADAPAGLAVGDYDAVLVGASVHAGSHQPEVRAFVEANRETLADRPTGFFQVSLSAAIPEEEARTKAATNVEAFLDATGWHPDRIGVFGGALRYSEYGFLTRMLMKRLAGKPTGATDTSRDYEFMDWEEVGAFAADFASSVAARLDAGRDVEGEVPE